MLTNNNLISAADLMYYHQGLKSIFVAQEEGKGLSSNDFTDADKEKLAGIEDHANNYILPTASEETKGGVKISRDFAVNGEGTMHINQVNVVKLFVDDDTELVIGG